MFATAWEQLGAVLRQELKRRGLWNSPPTYLGVYGFPSWDATAGGPQRADAGPLAELVAECYSFIFIDRLFALRAQLAVKPNIDGLVLLNVRHFLLERQRQHDPIGFRVFETLQAVVREGIAAGELFAVAGDASVRNETVIGFAPTAEPDPPARDLAPLVGRWNDDLLPDLLTGRGEPRRHAFLRLRAHLHELAGEGIEAFRFRDVVDPLKNDTRIRWAARMEEPGAEPGRGAKAVGEEGEALRAALPELPLEASDRFRDLADRVATAIEGLATDRRTRRYLAALWTYLRSQAAAEEGAAPAMEAALEDEEWARLSHRKLAQTLGIPRERMPDLFATLRGLVLAGRSAGSGAARARDRGPRPDPAPREPPRNGAIKPSSDLGGMP